MNWAKKSSIKILILGLGALILGIYMSQHHFSKKKINMAQFHGTYLENPRPVNTFSLTGIDQKTFDNDSLKGKWTLIFYGFTNCGYLCPTTMAELSKMYRILEEKKVTNPPQIVMVSIDPKRDDLDRLKSYVRSFHQAFYGAKGDEDTINAMTKEMGIAYAKMTEESSPNSENYDIQHSGAVMLFNPQGQLNAFFTTPHQAELLAKDYMMLVS